MATIDVTKPMGRYRLQHPNTAAVRFPSMQAAADFLFNFRNLPDFEKYTILDTEQGHVYSVSLAETCNGIEITHQGTRT